MSGRKERRPDDNVIDLAVFRRRGPVTTHTHDGIPRRLPSVYGKITHSDEVEYGMIDVDARDAPRLMRALLVLMDELLDVASM